MSKKSMTNNQSFDRKWAREMIRTGFCLRYLTWTTDGFIIRIEEIFMKKHGRHLTYYAVDLLENWHRRTSEAS